jgi:hypothetical protein
MATIVIPVLNQEPDWLVRCVESAAKQTAACEVLVITAKATNTSTYSTLHDLCSTNANIHVVLQERTGFAAAINTGILRARTDRVGLLLSDDWLEPVAVERCLQFAADIVSTGIRVYDASGSVELNDLAHMPTYEEYEALPTIEAKASYLEHFFLFRRRTLLQFGGVDERVGLTGPDDYDMIWTLLSGGATVSILEDQLYNYRDHLGPRLSLRDERLQIEDLAKILDKHGISGHQRRDIIEQHRPWFGKTLQAAAGLNQSRCWSKSLRKLTRTLGYKKLSLVCHRFFARCIPDHHQNLLSMGSGGRSEKVTPSPSRWPTIPRRGETG